MNTFGSHFQKIPRPADRRIALRVSRAAERELRAGHPWLFDNSIKEQSHEGKPGDFAVVFDNNRRFIAIGLYDPLSSIRVKVLQCGEPVPINEEWFRAKIKSAAHIREELSKQQTNGYRLIHGENDGFPGLVVDWYNQTAVIKIYSHSWIPHLRLVIVGLVSSAPVDRVVLRLSRNVHKQTRFLHGLTDGDLIYGSSLKSPIVFQENGLSFEVDPIQGQKTGFFLDQRENREKVEKLAIGRSVVDLFAYTGGFSLYAARGGCKNIISVDVSRPVLKTAKRNFALNHNIQSVAKVKHEIFKADAFEALKRFIKEQREFDLVIIDPPAFAKRINERERAINAYRLLTRLGLGVIRPGGILVQASCSSKVSSADFFKAVHAEAKNVSRPLRVIECTGQPIDHPVRFKESAYLKSIFAIAP